MARFLLLLLMIFSLTMTFGCAMKSAKSPTTAPARHESTAAAAAATSAPLRGEHGQIREETIAIAPQPTMTTEPLTQLVKPVLAGLRAIPFSYDQHLLSDEARDLIAANATILKQAEKVKFQLAGHCDERGSDQYNIALGERRAIAVRAYLLELGIEAERMETVSYGEEQPLESGQNEGAWRKNRRVEFVLLP